jgi:hypothetical protein
VASIEDELVVLLNNDVEVDDKWLAELKSGLEIWRHRLAACGSKILFYHDRSLVNHAGGVLPPIGVGVNLDLMKPDRQEMCDQGFVGCVSGASMIMPCSRIYHKLRATMGPYLKPERLFLGERNRLQCMLKILGIWNLIVAIPVSSSYALYRLLGFLR